MKHSGGCHCGQVRYEVTMDIKDVISCNCSICLKRGSLFAFTSLENFKLLTGQDVLTKYQFNKHVIEHLFCSKCGILSFANGKTPDGKSMAAINARCIDNIDLKTLNIQEYDGKHS